MPTGYTADVQEGKITTFKDFAHSCSRAFGAHILMRDNPTDPLPKKYEISKHYVESLEFSKKALADYLAMSAQDRRALMDNETARGVEYHIKTKATMLEQLERYQHMLKKTLNWPEPSAEFKEFKKFMIKQLEDSMEFDCNPEWDNKSLENLKILSFVEWMQNKEASLKRSVEYAEKSLADEIERTNKRNDWIAKLEESLQSYKE